MLYKLSCFALGVSLLCAGCQPDDIVSGYTAGKLIDVTISAGVTPVISVEHSTLTRADGLGNEDELQPEVYDYYLFQFAGTGDDAKLVATPLYVKTNADNPLQVVQLTESQDQNGNTVTHRLVAIANLGTSTYSWGVSKGETTYADVRKLGVTITRDDVGACYSDGKEYPVMSATWTGPIHEGNNTRENDLIELDFSLSVAKLSVKLANNAKGLTIERIALVNVPSVLNYMAVWNEPTPVEQYATLPPHTDEIGEDGSFDRAFYLPANPLEAVSGIDNITQLNRYAPPGATYIQLIVREDGTDRRYTTSLHVGGWKENADGLPDFDFGIALNTLYTLDYTITDKNDYFLDGRTDPYLSTNNYCSTTAANLGAYIRTGICPGKLAANSIRYEIDYAINSIANTTVLMGSGAAGSTAGTYTISTSGGNSRNFYAGTKNTITATNAGADYLRHTDIFELNLQTYTLTATYDGQIQSPVDYSGVLGQGELYLFANNLNGVGANGSYMKLFRFRLWIDGVLMRDMLATPSDAFTTIDGEPTPSSGMYDYVTQALFTSQIPLAGVLRTDKPFMLSIDTQAGNSSSTDKTYIVPFKTGACTVDFSIEWGDGTQTDYPEGTILSIPLLTHSYATPGEYTISIFSPTGEMPNINFGISTSATVTPVTMNDNPLKLIALHNEMLYINSTNLNYLFYGCTNLAGALPEKLFAANSQVTQFTYTFYDCTKLTGLPENLFANNKAATTFTCTFVACAGFTGEIPAGLFVNQPLNTSFNATFFKCSGFTSIPATLFTNNPLVTDIRDCFNACTGLKGIPAGLLGNNTKIVYINTLFSGCSGLEGNIPSDLFAACPLLYNLNGLFNGCKNLEGSIPSKLLANKSRVISCEYVFKDCEKLSGTIPEELFADCPLVTSFSQVFQNCVKLEGAIPSGLFAGNPLVMNFSDSFNGCTSLSGQIPKELFANSPLATTFTKTFSSSGITSIPSGLFDHNKDAANFNSTFYKCNITELPDGLFANCPKVTNFGSTFSTCSNLTGAIPANLFGYKPLVDTYASTFVNCFTTAGCNGSISPGLFDGSTAVTSFNSTFSNCKELGGEIPAGLFDHCPRVTSFTSTFTNCNKLGGSIPKGLFDKNTAVESFESTFFNCNVLDGEIPEGLFDHCPKVTTFKQTFYSTLITGIPKGLFDKNTKVTSFWSTFYGCSKLDCEVPEGLFDHCPEVDTFQQTFYNCTSLKGNLPAGLFDHCPKVTTFSGAFQSCVITGIPAGLFDKNTEVTDFSNTFYNCTKLEGTIPTGLFAHNLKVTKFNQVFRDVPKMELTANIFVADESKEADCAARFSQVGTVDFSYAFYSTTSTGLNTPRGIAPQLWVDADTGKDIYKGNGKFTKTQCFGGNRNVLNTYAYHLENWEEIVAAEWNK